VTNVTDEITRSMHLVLHQLVEGTPGVTGALVASADGFALASRLDPEVDAAGLAAMSAAALALSNQLSTVNGSTAAVASHHVGDDGQVMIVPVAHLAVLTMLTTPGAEARIVALAGSDAGRQLQRLFHGAAKV
jgi:predicted regulator of Ras-like GTPase activity (Roadblock/LC7/MglB family)